MGEIKSTLDLVMARTEHLKLSDADKQAQSRSQFSARLKGLLQKLLDQAFRLEEFERALTDLGTEFGLDFRAPLADVLLTMVTLEKDHSIALELLDNTAGVDTNDMQLVLNRYQEALDDARSDHSARIKQRLSDDKGLSGSAVWPNLDRDDQWKKAAASLMDQYSSLLEQAKKKIRNAAD